MRVTTSPLVFNAATIRSLERLVQQSANSSAVLATEPLKTALTVAAGLVKMLLCRIHEM